MLLDEHQREGGYKRNGKGRKMIKSSAGSFPIDTPQDRQSSFDPQLIKKRQIVLADSLQDKIVGLYGLGMSLRDISGHIAEMYDTQLSHTVLSQITDRNIQRSKRGSPVRWKKSIALCGWMPCTTKCAMRTA